MAYQAKQSQVLSQQLKIQKVEARVNLVAATSDAPSIISINNSTLLSTVITLDVGEPIASAYLCEVRNRQTGAIVATVGGPSTATPNKISVTCDGTGNTDLVVRFSYIVAE